MRAGVPGANAGADEFKFTSAWKAHRTVFSGHAIPGGAPIGDSGRRWLQMTNPCGFARHRRGGFCAKKQRPGIAGPLWGRARCRVWRRAARRGCSDGDGVRHFLELLDLVEVHVALYSMA